MTEGDAWHGSPVRALVAGLTNEQAAIRSAGFSHSIWELVRHMTAWAEIAKRRLAGEIVEPTSTEDWPPVGDSNPDAWKSAVESLERAHAELRRAVLALGDGHLDDRTPGKPYSLYVLLHGVVQHTAYHAGQIALLRRGSQAHS